MTNEELRKIAEDTSNNIFVTRSRRGLTTIDCVQIIPRALQTVQRADWEKGLDSDALTITCMKGIQDGKASEMVGLCLTL